MRCHTMRPIALLATFLLFNQQNGTVYGQGAIPTQQQLDQLLAPIALYPDALLAQITTAATNPQEILDVDNWLRQNPNLSGAALQSAAQQQGFDPAFIALVTFPQVLDMMAQNIDDYAAIGAAFAANQASVMDSIQRLRAQAYASGALQSNQQQQVLTQNQGAQQIIIVQPANPQVVYVPTYDPTVVYARPSTGAVLATALLSFGAGIAIGTLINNQPWGWGGWGWNWGRRTVVVNRNPWVMRNNYYRPPRYTFRPRPILYSNRPGYRGNWSYHPPNYRPPSGSRPPNFGSNRSASFTRPPVNTRPNSPRPAPPNNRPPNVTSSRPPASARPSSNVRPAQPRRNPYAGYQSNARGGNVASAARGNRTSVFNSSNTGSNVRTASKRGQQSVRQQKR